MAERQWVVPGYLFKHILEIQTLKTHKKKMGASNHISNDVKGKYTIYLSWMIRFHQ